jgi:predicted metallopeptidase
MVLDIDEIVGRVQLALKQVVGADVPVLCGYAAAKARAVARYADLIADAYAAGLLDEEEMARELDEIAHMTRRFTGALRGHPPAVCDHAAEAALAVIFGAIRGALGFAGTPLPQGLFDHAPPQAAA